MLALSILFAILSLHVFALNDWTVPCTTGTCSHDWVGDPNDEAFSSLAVDGSSQLLSDLTQAAGWNIVDCNPDWRDGSHDIRLLCDGTPEQIALCDHVFEDGAEHTVVRLPSSCGVGPFARVRKIWKPTNQTIPDHMKRELNSRAVEVRGMTLDYDFQDIPVSKGKLNFAITASNVAHPDISGRHYDLYRRGRDRYLHRRGLFDKFKHVGSAVTSAAVSVATAVTDEVEDVAAAVTDGVKGVASVASSVATHAADAVTHAGKAVATAAVHVVDKVESATSFNKTDIGKDIPLKFDKNITLLDTRIQCVNLRNHIDAHVHLDVDTHMDVQIKYGYHLVGSVVPFKLDDVAVFASLTGTTNLTFGLGLEATGQLDTFPIELIKLGLPGLSIPGIAQLGPELALEARLRVHLNVAAQMDIHANFDYGHIHMVFPEHKGNSSATSKLVQNENSLQLSTAHGRADLDGTIEAVLIPKFAFGIDFNVVEANVFLEMELGAEMEMKGAGAKPEAAIQNNGTAGGNVVVNTTAMANITVLANNTAVETGVDNAITGNSTVVQNNSTTAIANITVPATAVVNKTIAGNSTVQNNSEVTAAKNGTTPQPVNGCVRVNAIMEIAYGLQGTLPPLLPLQIKIPLFKAKKELLTKCFGNATPEILEEAEEEEAKGEAGKVAGEDASNHADSAATTHKKRNALGQRRHLQRRQSLADAAPKLANVAINLLVCPSSFIPLGALSALI